MVTRNSAPLDLNVGTVQAQGAQVANARPDVDKFTQNLEGADYGRESSVGRVLQTVLGGALQLGRQVIPKMQEEAYLEGAAAVGIVNSEEELEGNFITRDWKKSGYRDTMGRLALASKEAELAEDLVSWREKSPEEFSQYLAARRKELLPQLQGMSVRGRKGATANMLMSDQAAIKKHQVEHTKYQMEQEARSIDAALRTTVTNLGNEAGDAGSYEISTLAAYSTLKSVTLDNNKLPDRMKGKFLVDAAEYALSKDHVMLYDQIMNKQTTLPNGKTGTMAEYMTWDDEVKLSKLKQESENRTEGIRAMRWVDDKANMQADWDNPNTPLMPLDKVRAFAEEGVRRKFLSADQYGSLMRDYYNASEKKAAQGTLGKAYSSNDVEAIHGLNKTEDEALAAWKATTGKNMSSTEALNQLLTMGADGRTSALREAGKMLAPAITQLGNGGVVNPANAANVASILGKLDAAEAGGKAGLFVNFLSGLDEEQRTKVMYLREGIRKGLDPTTAVGEAEGRMVEDGKLTQPQRQAMQSASAKDDVAVMRELEPRGLFGSLGLMAKSLVSANAANELAVRPLRMWFEDETRVNEVAAGAKLAVAEELRVLSASSPYLSTESRKTAALAAVAQRTIPTNSGPLILPRGLTPESFFGTSASVPKDRIGAAIDEYIKPADGNRMAYSVNSQGQLQFKEFNGKSELVKSGIVDSREVSKLVASQQDKLAAQFNVYHGTGATVQTPQGSVTFNGDNTAGIDNRVMFNIRKGLVEHEGYRNKPYADSGGAKHQDGSPVMTVGAGISSTNEFYPKVGPDGAVPVADTDRAFVQASNAAAKQAVAFTNRVGLPGTSSTSMFTELFYQSGPGFASVGLPLAQAMKSGELQGAVTALHNTPAYKMAHAARKKYYDGILFNAMKGQ